MISMLSIGSFNRQPKGEERTIPVESPELRIF